MSDCIFCQIVAGAAPSWKVYETDSAYAFLSIHPVSEYHTLVIPKKHYINLFDIPAEELSRLMVAVKHVIELYSEKLGIQNLQLVSSAGAEAQQDVFHLHVHIVPRQLGDGQNITWTTHPEMAPQFDELLAKLR